MAERTGQQLGYFDTFGLGTLYGGYGYAWGGARTAGGESILPPIAAVLGSGATEGRNAYAAGVGYGPAGLGGYGVPLPGTYATYDLMMAHPTIALARAAVMLPILAAGWKYQQDDKRAPAGALDLIHRVFSSTRTEILIQMLRAIDVGNQPFEIVWGVDDRDGATVPTWFKPLLPGYPTTAVTTVGGQLVGLQQGEAKITDAGRWLWHAHDVRGTAWHGRGRLENCRRQWQNWLADDDRGYELSGKAAAIVPFIGHPPDAKTLAPGEQTANQIALGLGRALQQRRPIAFQNLTGAQVDDIERNAALAGKSMWSIDTLDMGDTGPSQQAITEKLAYRDKLLVRGYLRSERSVIEADTAGSRADSESHTASIGDTDADVQHSLAVITLNRQAVDAILIENYGPKAKGSVWIEPVQIVDEVRAMMNQFTAALLGDPLLRAIAFEQIDTKALIAATGLKLNDKAPPMPDEMPTEGQEQQDNAGGDPGEPK